MEVGSSFRNNPELKAQYEKFRSEYWNQRIDDVDNKKKWKVQKIIRREILYMGDWEKAVDLICDYLEEEDQTEEEFFTGGVSDDKVKQAEIALDIELPKTYVSFLKRFGSGGIGCADFFGIENKTDESENFTVVKITQMYREKVNLPKYLVVIENFGDYIVCLNTSEKHGDDCCVVSYGLYDGDNILQCSDSFYGYMLEKLDDALN